MKRGLDQLYKNKHVFAVNGDPPFLEMIRVLLQDEQFNVTTTNFVPKTFDQIAALDPDLIIIDLVIGERFGWELLERLQENAITAEIPVIVTSTEPRFLKYAEQNQERHGANRYVAKPLDLDILLDTINDLIGEA